MQTLRSIRFATGFALAALALLTPAAAQTRDADATRDPQPAAAATRAPSSGRAVGIRGLFNVGPVSLAAADSFDAVLGKSNVVSFGGGVQVTFLRQFFGQVDVSRMREDGERVFVANRQVFRLGIPTTVTMTPIEFTGGWRYVGRRRAGAAPGRARFRIVPYAGGGVGIVQYEETSDFAESGEDVSESFTSYHLLGGVEVPIWQWISAGVEVRHRWVPDALGTGGVSDVFGEDDLGGTTFRFNVLVGR